jgi:O-antigen/teichoic acid export membrane protein
MQMSSQKMVSTSKVKMRRVILATLLISILFIAVTPVRADDSLLVYYFGDENSMVYSALKLTGYTIVTDPAAAQVFVINGEIPTDPIVAERIKSGEAGLVLILGPGMTDAQAQELLGFPVNLQEKTNPVSITAITGVDDPLLTEIIWNSAPQVRERMNTETPISSVQPLVIAYEGGEWILWQAHPGTFVFNAYLNSGANPQIQDWAYFNYLIYHLVTRAGGHTPLSFEKYPASPVPHDQERNFLWALMGLMLITTFTAFFLVRRYSMVHPEELDRIVADHQQFDAHEAGTEWEDVGFHRPLSGFLVALTIGLIFFIPLIIYQNVILPTYILPSAQALGIWGRVTQFFNVAWLFFDMGTSIAFIKFLSEYRVKDPKKGVQYGQVFVWWQALSGAVQVALVIGLASAFAPGSAYALYAWSIIIHAFIQIPGFYQVFRHALTGYQRLDYSRLLDILNQVLLPMVVQPLFVGIMFYWGQNHPMYGGPLGGLFGLGLAAYAAELLTFLGGWWLYRRVGYNARILFLAHFDWEVIKSSFRFGVFEMLGSAAWSFGQAAEIAITQNHLINYAEIWGNWGMAQNFIFAFNVTQTLNDGVMPAISEAFSQGRIRLSQYYSVMAYKYNGMFSAFLAAVLLAVAPKFIVGASGVEFRRAAVYVIPLIIWGAFQFPSWVGDNVQLGSNKPYLKAILVFAEQMIRIFFMWILLERFQVTALIIAYFIGLFTKGIVAYIVNNKYCYPQRFFVWQSLTAPILAGAAHFICMYWVAQFIWKGDQITSILIFFIGVLPSFPVYMFLYGLVGGWDKATLAELENAASMTGFIRPLAKWGLYAPTALGAKISPLNGRFPITIREEAMAEATALTNEKVKL